MRKWILATAIVLAVMYYIVGGLEIRQFAGPKSGLSFNPLWPVHYVFGKPEEIE